MIYYNESVLLTIVKVIGTPTKMDKTTLNMHKGHFAKVCVQIDWTIIVVKKFNLNGN